MFNIENFINNLFLFFKKTKLAPDKRSNMSSDIVVESSYKGVHLELPVTKQIFHDLVNSFKLNQVNF